MQDSYRYFFQATFPGHTTKNHLVTMPKRPELLIEEIVDSDGSKRPGKTRWLPLTVKYFWPEETPDESTDLFQALADIYGFGAVHLKESKSPDELMSKIATHLGSGVLSRYHKQSGTMIEEWRLKGLWPHSVNFGEMCYSTRADIEIEIVWRFTDAEYVTNSIQ